MATRVSIQDQNARGIRLMVGFAMERVRQKVMQRTIPTIVSLDGCVSTRMGILLLREWKEETLTQIPLQT